MNALDKKSKSTLSLPNLENPKNSVDEVPYLSERRDRKSVARMEKTNGQAKTSPSGSSNIKGWLHKWTNYIKGYQRRWFVLNQGILSYYRSQAEMKYTCRGTMYMRNATIRTLDSCHFVIRNGSTTIHLKANTEAEKLKWISSLEMAKAIRFESNNSGKDDDSYVDLNSTALDVNANEKQLQQKLEELESSFDLIKKQQAAIQKCIRSVGSTEGFDQSKLRGLLVSLDERTTIFRITATNLINNSRALLSSVKSQHHTVGKAYAEERELRARLEYVVEQMAKQQQMFEKNLIRSGKGAYQAMPGSKIIDSNNRSADVEFIRTSSQRHNGGGGGVIGQPVNNQITQPLNHLKDFPNKELTDTVTHHSASSVTTEDEDVFHDALDLELLRMPVGSIVSDQSTADRVKSPLRSTDKAGLMKGTDDLSDDVESDTAAFQYEYESTDVEDDDDEEDESEEGEEESSNLGVQRRRTRKTSTASIVIRMPHLKPEQKLLPIQHKGEVAANRELHEHKTQHRRSQIPFKPDYSLNLWSIIKNCVGKDLSRIPVPVNFSEPLSMLQRLTEELEYSELLDAASQCTDSCEQMAYVAAFTISVYSTTADRAAKPFNPLLGETYECDRSDDLGWKSIAEQVSHHPPALATYAEGKSWKLWQEFVMTSKFRGQYLSVTPLGHSHLEFPNTGHHYIWKKVTTCVQNIIIGKLWIDNVGEMDIINQITKDRCHIKFYEYSMFSKEPPRKVTGIITDGGKVAKWIINGKWNDYIEGAVVKNPSVITTRSRFETLNPIMLWRRKYPPPLLSRMYNFTTLAVQLNEEEHGVAPTDSRKRPDQRLMELGKWDEANEEKVRLEEKQRSKRRQLEETNARRRDMGEPDLEHTPAWFNKQHDPYTNSDLYVYTGEYWKCKASQDWSRCPNIY